MTSWRERDLRKAIHEGQFISHFQPKVDLRTAAIVGFEALTRWQHPRYGLISPSEFIPAIEESGLSQRFTAKMLHTVFAGARDCIPESMYVAVNVSAPQLLGGSLAAVIDRIAEQECFPLQRLVIEITETALVDDLERALACARMLKSMGVRLSLDDFGTGYSSLHHLHVLPFDEIKLDMSFVRSILYERESRKIVAAMVGLGQSLGMVTVAEGIEETAQATLLISMGCDRGQGWLYGRPMPAQAIPGLIASRSTVPSVQSSDLPLAEAICANLEAYPAQRLAQLQAIYDGAPVGLCFVDAQLRFVSINERLAAVNHRTVAEHLGRNVSEIIPELYDQIEPYLRRALRGEAIYDLEVHAPDSSSGTTERTLLATYQPARDEAGEVIGVSVAVMDITNHKRAELAKRNDDACLKAVFHGVEDGLIVVSAEDGRVIAANRQAEELLGRSLPPGSAFTSSDLWPAFDSDGRRVELSADLLVAAFQMGRHVHDEEVLFERADGTWRWFSLSIRPIRGSNGESGCGVFTLRDIDESKRRWSAVRDPLNYPGDPTCPGQVPSLTPSFLAPLRRRIPAASLGLSKPVFAASVGEPSYCSESPMDCSRGETAIYKESAVTGNDDFVEERRGSVH